MVPDLSERQSLNKMAQLQTNSRSGSGLLAMQWRKPDSPTSHRNHRPAHSQRLFLLQILCWLALLLDCTKLYGKRNSLLQQASRQCSVVRRDSSLSTRDHLTAWLSQLRHGGEAGITVRLQVLLQGIHSRLMQAESCSVMPLRIHRFSASLGIPALTRQR